MREHPSIAVFSDTPTGRFDRCSAKFFTCPFFLAVSRLVALWHSFTIRTLIVLRLTTSRAILWTARLVYYRRPADDLVRLDTILVRPAPLLVRVGVPGLLRAVLRLGLVI